MDAQEAFVDDTVDDDEIDNAEADAAYDPEEELCVVELDVAARARASARARAPARAFLCARLSLTVRLWDDTKSFETFRILRKRLGTVECRVRTVSDDFVLLAVFFFAFLPLAPLLALPLPVVFVAGTAGGPTADVVSATAMATAPSFPPAGPVLVLPPGDPPGTANLSFSVSVSAMTVVNEQVLFEIKLNACA